MPFVRTIFAMLAFVPLLASAQNSPAPTMVQEDELRACLLAEREGVARFNKLEQQAADLKGTEQLLAQRRITLQERQRNLDKRKPRQEEVDELNNMIQVFNDQTDQLNLDKERFEQDVQKNEMWMNTTVAPKCDPIKGKSVNAVTSFYACNMDRKEEMMEVPHCLSLPNTERLKTCIQAAGSKVKAQALCNNPNTK